MTTYNVSYDCATESFGVVTKNETICHPEDPGDLIAFNQWFWLNNSPPEGGGACAFEYHATEFTSCNPAGGPFADVPAPGSLPTDLELCLCPSDESSAESSATCDQPDTCGTPNGDPTLLVTLTWTDSDETKEWVGCTWCNGQTKTVYASNYSYFNTGDYAEEFWQRSKVGGGGFAGAFWMEAYYASSTSEPPERLLIDVPLVGGGNCRDEVSTYSTQSYRQNASCLGILGTGDMPVAPGGFLLGKQKNNSYTDANGITYTWTEGTGW